MKQILLVEDTDADAQLVERTLERVGVLNPVHRLRNGVEAVAYLDKAAATAAIAAPVPSILLLDLKMPLMTGFEVLEWLQGRAEFAKMLRIVLSQLDDNRSLQRAYTLGAHSFLIKPVVDADLRGVIEAFPGYWTFSGKAGRGVRSDANSPSDQVRRGHGC